MLPEMQTIESSSNPLLKRVRAIAKGLEDGWILLEGHRLLQDALSAGIEVEAVFVRADREQEWRDFEFGAVARYAVPAGHFQKLGSVKNPPPVLAIARTPQLADLGDLRSQREPLVLVVVGMADPGNLGAVARSAEAAGACALIRVGPGVSPWNPRSLRGSMGSLLRLPVLSFADVAQAKDALEDLGFTHRCAATRGGQAPSDVDWGGSIALWVSGETGETPPGMQTMQGLTIPLATPVESLNVTVAASLLLFAAGRVPLEEEPS